MGELAANIYQGAKFKHKPRFTTADHRPRADTSPAASSGKPTLPISIRKPKSSKRLHKSFRMLRTTAAEEEVSVPESMPDVEIIEMTQEEKQILKESWKVVYSEVGSSLCYVGGTSSSSDGSELKASGGSGGDIEETFIRLFEGYPSSQEFFVQFRGSPIQDIRDNVKMSKVLKEHAVRVFQLVEKVIGRLECLHKSKMILLRLGRFHRHVGIPSDYFGVMPNIFLHAVRPYLERVDMWNEETQDAWMNLFSHITRVMTHGHTHYHLIETAAATAKSPVRNATAMATSQ